MIRINEALILLMGIFTRRTKEKADWLVVGLGNPGSRYEQTRHNIGWMVVHSLCEKSGKPLRASSSIYLLSNFKIAGVDVAVAAPTTFMNASGEAVVKLSKKLGLPADKIVVIADEYNFELGKIHLRLDGSDGGHNGLASVIDELGTMDFYRLRCGIGRNFPAGGMVDYVLSDFLTEDQEMRSLMVARAVDAIEYLIRNGSERAMSAINSGSLWGTK